MHFYMMLFLSIIIIGLVFILLTLKIGNYFVSCSLIRSKKNKEMDKDLFKLSNMALKNIKKNNEEVEKWLKKVELEKISINSYGYKLIADEFNQESNNWVILVHGYLGSKEEMLHFAKWYYKKGFNVLIPDLRSHGESEGKIIGMGYVDRLDIINWINYINSKDKCAKIVLHGHSMGGATVLFTSGENPKGVVSIISDCSYTSINDEFKKQLKNFFHLPSFPILSMANSILYSRKDGYDLNKGNVVKFVSKSKIPTLFIHGSEDIFVPTKMVYDLYKNCNAKKKLVIFDKAGHAESELADANQYYNEIETFLNNNIK